MIMANKIEFDNHGFNGIFHEDFNSYEEAKEFAEAIGSEVMLYSKRAGNKYWRPEIQVTDPIEMHEDESYHCWYTRSQFAREIIKNLEGLEIFWSETVEKAKEALDKGDIDRAIKALRFYKEVSSAFDDCAKDEAVAISTEDECSIIKLYPTHGEYDNRSWTLGVPDPHEKWYDLWQASKND